MICRDCPEATVSIFWTHWSKPIQSGMRNRLRIRFRIVTSMCVSILAHQKPPMPST